MVASRGGDDGSVHINQDIKLYASILKTGEQVSLDLAEGRHAWVQLISGLLDVNGESLKLGDGAAISEELKLKLKAGADNTEFLLFDLN
ncbi:MAG TPA: hypothetical protein VK612_02465 [Pyrinomonadaceae bacterium]|nr:hypothetical protein [Pyrinomonadaceae bacterium]